MAKKRPLRNPSTTGKTKVDQIIDRFKTHPVLAWVVVAVVVVAALDPVLNVFDRIRTAVNNESSSLKPAEGEQVDVSRIAQSLVEASQQLALMREELSNRENAFRAEQIRSDVALLEGRKDELAATIDAMQAENINMAERLADIRAELAKAEDGIQRAAAPAPSPEERQTLTQAQRNVATLQAETNKSEQLRSAQTNRLSVIREQILPSEVSKRLYVGNLPFTTNETDLIELFGRIGKVDSLNLVRDRETGRVRGFAFVEMANDALARQAIEQLDGQDFGGRRLTVNKATPSHGN
jgi:hypothetical protein